MLVIIMPVSDITAATIEIISARKTSGKVTNPRLSKGERKKRTPEISRVVQNKRRSLFTVGADVFISN
jgi:hypothetical protein